MEKKERKGDNVFPRTAEQKGVGNDSKCGSFHPSSQLPGISERALFKHRVSSGELVKDLESLLDSDLGMISH